MKLRFRTDSLLWVVATLAACGYLVWGAAVVGRRVDRVTNAAKDPLTVDAASPTGYAGGMRRLILATGGAESYGWIEQTQLMLARREWRVRQVDNENPPFGRDVNAASPYRWWLGVVAWLDHRASGRPLGLSVERAALVADPALQALLLLACAGFVAWRFGAATALLVPLAVAGLFPFASNGLPGAPDQHVLAQGFALASLLVLLAGVAAAGREGREAAARNWFAAAGVVGGMGLWISARVQAPLIAGMVIGAIAAAWFGRGRGTVGPGQPGPRLAWRAWALGGAGAVLAGYLAEFFPHHLGGWQLETVHPLYGVAWLGCGELLGQTGEGIAGGTPAWRPARLFWTLLAVAGIAALPAVMLATHNPGFLAAGAGATRLAKLPGGPVAASLLDWLEEDGFTATVWATLLPLLLLVPALALFLRRGTAAGSRMMLGLALGPSVVAVGFACRHLSWWGVGDAMLLGLAVAVMAAAGGTARSPAWRWACPVLMALLCLPGAIQLFPPGLDEAAGSVSEPEVKELADRDLAHWLAREAGPPGAVVLAPPVETASLCYYGGVGGLTTPDLENRPGFVAAARIVSATTAEEALELMRRRGVTHILIPSWDAGLDDYARWGLGQTEGSFIDGLHRWGLPLWIRPVPYQYPTIPGLEPRSVVVLEVVDEQDDASAMARLAEYFVEMGQLDAAAGLAQSLRRFPANLGALAARGQVESARGDAAALAQTLGLVETWLARSGSRPIPWDRRVSLAILLARGKRTADARAQVQRCIAEIDESRIRSLSTGSLFNLLVLSRAFDAPLADARLRGLALGLLPEDLRAKL